MSPAWQADSLLSHLGSPLIMIHVLKNLMGIKKFPKNFTIHVSHFGAQLRQEWQLLVWFCKKDDAPVEEKASSWLLLQKLFYTTLQTFLILFLYCAVLCRSVMSKFLRPRGLQPAWLLCPWGYSRQEYWSWLPCPPPGDLPDPGIEPRSASQADSLPVGLFSTKS